MNAKARATRLAHIRACVEARSVPAPNPHDRHYRPAFGCAECIAEAFPRDVRPVLTDRRMRHVTPRLSLFGESA